MIPLKDNLLKSIKIKMYTEKKKCTGTDKVLRAVQGVVSSGLRVTRELIIQT